MRAPPVLCTLCGLVIGQAAPHGVIAQAARQATAVHRSTSAGDAALSAELTRLEREYVHAGAVPVDTLAPRQLTRADATLVMWDGGVESGAQQVHDFATGGVVLDSLSVDSMQVRTRAPGAAVVTGIVVVRQRGGSGGGPPQDMSGRYRILDVWQRVGGRWQVASEAFTRIVGQ